MKRIYLKPEMQVIEIERQAMLAGSIKTSFIDGESNIYDGGDTSSGGISSID